MEQRRIVNKRRKLSKSSLLWFVRSRPYALVPELRRRFELEDPDEVNALRGVAGQPRVWIGLPQRAARMVEELCREGRLGLQTRVDVRAPVAVGVFALDLARTDRTLDPGRVPPPPPMEPPPELEDEREE